MKQAAFLVIALAAATMSFAGEAPVYELAVTFDLAKATIRGTAIVEAKPGEELTITRGELHILSIRTGQSRTTPAADARDPFTVRAAGPVEIRYEGSFDGSDVDVIDREKILLRNVWYPVIEGAYRYRLKATVPRDFDAISEGDRVLRTEANSDATCEFDLPYPQRAWDGITFVASTRWVSRSTTYRDIPLSIHLLKENASRLADTLRDAQRYLEQLEARLGRYPFGRLAIVENPVALRYSLSMPTYVLLSQESVAADAPEDSSLDHELAHQWFGNAVLADYEGGNWAEGLASYFSDHLENERLGRGWQRRQRMMAAHQSFVAGRAELPLAEFEEEKDRASRIVGYAKAALVIHMLRREVGDERFFDAMRAFVRDNLHREASWSTLRSVFERSTGADLARFFHQWVDTAATPELGLQAVSAKPSRGGFDLRFAITQGAQPFSLAVPVTVHFDDGGSEVVCTRVSRGRTDVTRWVRKRPVRIVLDESYDVVRKLTAAELPPMIATLLARPRVTLIGTVEEQAKFGRLIEAFEREGAAIALQGEHQQWTRRGPAMPAPLRSGRVIPPRPIARLSESNAKTIASLPGSVILLGEHAPLIRELFGDLQLSRGPFSMTVLKHPRNPGDMVAIFTAGSKAEVDDAYEALLRRPRYSSATFSGGVMRSYELKNGERGIGADIVFAPGHLRHPGDSYSRR